MEGLLGAAALVAAVGIGVRIVQQRAAERARPGATAARAIAIEDFGDIDVAVRMQLCGCGGRFVIRGEGPAAGTADHLRVVHLECRKCERERRLFFDVSTVRH